MFLAIYITRSRFRKSRLISGATAKTKKRACGLLKYCRKFRRIPRDLVKRASATRILNVRTFRGFLLPSPKDGVTLCFIFSGTTAAALNPTHVGCVASVNATLLLVTLESDQRHFPGDIDSLIRRCRWNVQTTSNRNIEGPEK